ncbi:L-ascorbate oxidase [Pseudomonas sp. SDI]|uniref:multicopper oxidase family protein n=1 Tax=Pseudomonas sp. SDI TaxID=2170734 RepID=UPI000DE5D842|nr:multicopper oxidase family protein [Pseudomonas sp. SDI]PWB34832.1 L-ascorbate oxidase [Pseudomonas sp. SDI]
MNVIHNGKRPHHWSTGLSALALLCAAAGAQADGAARAFVNPPALGQAEPTRETAKGGTLLMQAAPDSTPQPNVHAGHERLLDLVIKYTDSTIYDPATGKDVPVRLRSYTGTGVDEKRPYVAPTIDVTPGDTVRINLDNQLDADPSCSGDNHSPDKPHCFNGTNLHSHGLWVSPAGNSDNVLLSINPKVKFQYEYNIPADHPAGTFWYHPHRHGSTALQVGSGMAGALIIRGQRPPTTHSTGDIDTLLKPTPEQPFAERLLVLQQIPYACGDKNGKLPKGDIKWNCSGDEIGVVESYDQFGPGDWADSGRFTSVNGEVQPVFAATVGQYERWRLVHAGVRETVTLQFLKMDESASTSAALANGVAAGKADAFIASNCKGTRVNVNVIAADGLTLGAAQNLPQVTLQPGYRFDLLVAFPEKGQYCVVDGGETAAGNVSQVKSDRQLLGFVEVKDNPGKTSSDSLQNVLVAAANRAGYAEAVKSSVVNDLNSGLKLSNFIPHKDIGNDELIAEEQQLVFLIDTRTKDTKFAVGTTPQNAVPYVPGDIPRQLTLGDSQRWVLSSAYASHPFHIHVNPFQIEKILNDKNQDLSLPNAVDDDGDTQFAGLSGVWKDTLFVKGPAGKGIDPMTNKKGVYTVYVKTRYQRYIGEYVLHCHILDHEDQGMMQNVKISLPEGPGGSASAAHGSPMKH